MLSPAAAENGSVNPLAVFVASDSCSPLLAISVAVGFTNLSSNPGDASRNLTELAKANDGLLPFGLLDPDLVRLHGRRQPKQGGDGKKMLVILVIRLAFSTAGDRMPQR